jgi:hyperosmotically inducible protein
MKQKLQILSASAVSFLAFSALAQPIFEPMTNATGSAGQRMHQARTESLKGAVRAGDIIGMEVQNFQNEKLGKVDNLAVDVESGRVIEVILSTGGFLGIGDTLTAVPPGALQHDPASKFLHLDATKAKIKSAPKFDMSEWDASTQSNQLVEVYAYFGEQPYFVSRREGYLTTNQDGTLTTSLPRNMDGTINTEAPRTVEKSRNAEMARNIEETTNMISTRTQDGTWTLERYPNERLGYVQKGSKLMGTSVKNLQDQKLGSVENFVVDLSASRIVAVIISSGGFLGMGDELSAIPPTALRFNAEHDVLQLDASKEMLASSPHFKANQWPDLSQPAYVSGVYRAYKVEPYFTTDATVDTDNTRQNVRERDSRMLTPLDQGNSQTDMNTSAQIRKEILATEGMSVNARNIKIITQNGHITLRGSVNSAEERRLIAEIADRIAHSGNVDNQLEVQPTPQ